MRELINVKVKLIMWHWTTLVVEAFIRMDKEEGHFRTTAL